ncbi:MAG TPA: hypothetical protein DCW90_23295 [Lachnospiraceae bacterium]|nr:hypothetical protein [Lachnospiraceae bacterium]
MTQAIYETFARMSQPFTNNVPDVDFHGANGNIILGGDAIAADRYTECRLAKITEDYVLSGLKKNAVPMTLNFSEDEYMPTVMPSVFPRLLVNGAQGIGVSVANTWLPHNLIETINLVGRYVKTGVLHDEEYYPDFPTGGTIVNKDELSVINETGKGKVILRANYRIDGKEIIFYEMPYQVYIEPVIEKIKEQINKEELTGISGVYNKSDKNQIALVVECSSKSKTEEVLNQLFQQTPLQSQYNANQNGIISKTPVLLNLQQTVDVYVNHNLECIKNEYKFDLDAANSRIEILEGLHEALTDINSVVSYIKNAESANAAKELLMAKLSLTESQAKAILDMKLSRLTKLDGIAIDKELEEKKNLAVFCNTVIASEDEQKKIFLDKLRAMGKEYKIPRRTQVIQKEIQKKEKNGEKPKPVPESVIVSYNPLGYLQCIPVSQYRNSDFYSFKATTADNFLVFTNTGRFFRPSVSKLKLCGNKDKGTAIGSIIKLEQNEKVLAVLSNEVNEKRPYVFLAMDNGMVKKAERSVFLGSTQNLKGQIAVKTESNVVGVFESNGDDCLLETSDGYRIRFDAEEVRSSGKNSAGVKGISLHPGEKVVKCKIVSKSTITKTPTQKRGGKGSKIL